MINIDLIKQYFPKQIRDNTLYHKYMLKEYIQLLILDYLSMTAYVRKLVFIGGTNLRLVSGIDRFSEDIDFDCKNLSKDEFLLMTNNILSFLRQNGYRAEIKDNKSSKLQAFRRNIYFPELLFDLGLSGHRTERFLIKIESQDQQIEYDTVMRNVKGCGFFFPVPVPPIETLCSMKVSAMLSRQKGRDFYDTLFLLGLTQPDYNFLSAKMGINNQDELKLSTEKTLKMIDLNHKRRDFEHLLFNRKNSNRILHFGEFIKEL